jgi:hypothetical protein
MTRTATRSTEEMDELTKLRKSRATSYIEEFLADPSNRKIYDEYTEEYRREESEEAAAERAGSSVGLEQSPLKRTVEGSSPSQPTKR